MSEGGNLMGRPPEEAPSELMPQYRLREDYPLMWERSLSFDFSERLGGSARKLDVEIDAALRELWNARAALSAGRETCNALRLPDMRPLREVVRTVQHDDVVRVEMLSCGHTKTTLVASSRPAARRRCLKCAGEETETPPEGTKP